MTDLNSIYSQQVQAGIIKDDPQQRFALSKLQVVMDELNQKAPWWQFKKPKVRGLYFYGSVGIGKTYLMDLFYENLQTKRKLRMHFHRFMQQVDAGLRALQGQAEPLSKVAETISKKARVLCFDEFFVTDIADAMILGRLFGNLFERGVTLIATSNIPPDKLYWDGLHRKRFLPTIDLIKQHCAVFGFDSELDYRLRTLLKAGIYHTPLGDEAEKKMNQMFHLFSHGEGEENTTLYVEHREINTIKLDDHVAWFDFDVLCNVPRSQLDYLRLAERFETILLSNVSQMAEKDTAKATFFISLIDVFYDQGVHLILSAQTKPQELYQGETKAFAFERTVSRLIEMQSQEYFEKASMHAESIKHHPAQNIEIDD